MAAAPENQTPDLTADKDWQSDRDPPQRSASFITNREYCSSLGVYTIFVVSTFFTQMNVEKHPKICVCAAVVLMIFLSAWQLKARFIFGRIHARAYLDPVAMSKMPEPRQMVLDPEDATPFIPANDDNSRKDPAEVAARGLKMLEPDSKSLDPGQESLEPEQNPVVALLAKYVQKERVKNAIQKAKEAEEAKKDKTPL